MQPLLFIGQQNLVTQMVMAFVALAITVLIAEIGAQSLMGGGPPQREVLNPLWFNDRIILGGVEHTLVGGRYIPRNLVFRILDQREEELLALEAK